MRCLFCGRKLEFKETGCVTSFSKRYKEDGDRICSINITNDPVFFGNELLNRVDLGFNCWYFIITCGKIDIYNTLTVREKDHNRDFIKLSYLLMNRGFKI